MRELTTNEKTGSAGVIVAVLGILLGIPETRDALRSSWLCFFPPPKAIVVASMNFPEQYALGEVIAQMLQDRHVRVQRNVGQSGDDIRKGIEQDTVQCYVDYTGALFTRGLGQEPKSDEAAVYAYVKEEYAKKNVAISKQFEFESPWVILIRADTALRFNVHKMSDLARVARRWRAAFVPDFVTDDIAGADKFKEDYGLNFLHEETLFLSSIYNALSERRVDVISGNATDPELLEAGFVTLEDDLHSFPPYFPVILARRD